MKKLFNNFSNNKGLALSLSKGFTLVELLVVIGVLGILAAGLLATIDPLEQFRKASDSNRRTASLDLVNAINRYYASRQAFPWNTAANGGADCNAAALPASLAVTGLSGDSTFSTCIDELVKQGELKSSFKTQYGILSKMFVTDTSVGEAKKVGVCFNPESKSLSRGAETIYTQAGAVAAAGVCDTTALRETNTATCYICAQ